MEGRETPVAAAAGQRVEFTQNVRRIYLAGKVSMYDDWREQLVKYAPVYYAQLETDPGHAHKFRYGGIVFATSNGWDAEENPDLGQEHWPVRERALFGRYDYTGPYVTDLGHGGNDFRSAGGAPVVAECLSAIKDSDLVFAWIDGVTAYATLAELGYAKALGKQVWIAGPAEYADLWFLYQMADRLSIGATDPGLALRALLTRVYMLDENSDMEGE